MPSDTALGVMKNTFPPKAPSPPALDGPAQGIWCRQSQLCRVCKWASLTNFNIHQEKVPWGLQGQTLRAKRVADGYIGVMGGLWAELPSRQGKAFKGSAAWYRAKSPALEVAWPYVHEFAVLGSAPAISEGSGCGKEFFCTYPGQHLPCAPSHCLTSTGFIPLLSPATHAQKCTRRACSSSSAV